MHSYPSELTNPQTLRERIQGINIDPYVTIVTQKLHEMVPLVLERLDVTEEPLIEENSELESGLQLQFFFNAVNFSYWPSKNEAKWHYAKRNPSISGGSEGLFRALEDAKEQLHRWDAKAFQNLDLETFNSILGSDENIPMKEERLDQFRQTAEALLAVTDHGKYIELIDRAEGDALKLLELLVTNIPTYRDVSTWQGLELPFLKRAQLLVKTTSDYLGKHKKKGLNNLEKLTAFSDYKVPQVFEMHGALVYNDALREKLARLEELPTNSPEEVAIRIATIRVVEQLSQLLAAAGHPITSGQIDTIIWLLGRKEKAAGTLPFHRTRTLAY